MTPNTKLSEYSQSGSGGWAREGTLTEEKDERVLQLKNGARIESVRGNALYHTLCALLEQYPEAFRALLAVARNELQALPKAHIGLLRNGLLLNADGIIVPGTYDVLLSAYRETPDGPALVSPFRFSSEEELKQEEQAEKEGLDRVRRWLRGEESPGGSGPYGRN